MTSLDSIVDRVCEASRADFAFVLTRRGRLATSNAPVDMPEKGRRTLVSLAEVQLRDKPGTISHVELPREALVPYGGAAPVDVYFAARDEAILCAVLATFTEQREVADAISSGANELDTLLRVEADRRARRRTGVVKKDKDPKETKDARDSKIPPAKGSSPGKRRLSSAPPNRATMPFGALEDDAKEPFSIEPVFDPDEMPTITITEVKVGRATLAAIEIDRDAPEITYSQATIGRQTLSEIELSLLPKGDARSSIPNIRVELTSLPAIDGGDFDVTDRRTLPFTERAEDAKRSFELGERLREGLGPVVLDHTKTRTVVGGKSKPTQPPPQKPVPKQERKRTGLTKAPAASKNAIAAARVVMPRDSNIELWHSALAQTLVDEPTTQDDDPPPSAPPSRGARTATAWGRSDHAKEPTAKEPTAKEPTAKEAAKGKSVWPTAQSGKSNTPKRGRSIPPASALPPKRASDKPKR